MLDASDIQVLRDMFAEQDVRIDKKFGFFRDEILVTMDEKLETLRDEIFAKMHAELHQVRDDIAEVIDSGLFPQVNGLDRRVS